MQCSKKVPAGADLLDRRRRRMWCCQTVPKSIYLDLIAAGCVSVGLFDHICSSK
jgi:hypothetical protein